MSLARGPALVLGTILTAVGLYLLYKARSFPPFSNFPNADASKDGDFLFGLFGANGWTGMLTAVGGGLLLFGAAQHLLAKTMSLIVGAAFGAAAVIALVSGNVLGMAAANGWTKLGWAVCAVILLFNTLVPRRRREVIVADDAVAHDAPVADDAVAHDAPVADDAVAHDAPVADDAAVHDAPVAENDRPAAPENSAEPTAEDDTAPTAVHHDQPTDVSSRERVAANAETRRG